ncbi:MAG: flagellar assembly protein FliH [Spirochaetia bacterium]
MAKNIFEPVDVLQAEEPEMLSAPYFGPTHIGAGGAVVFGEVIDGEDSYVGPTAAELREEAEEFKRNWAVEKQGMIEAANKEVNDILKRGEDRANEVIDTAQQEAESMRDELAEEKKKVESEIDKIKNDAIQSANDEAERIRQATRDAGYKDGKEAGYQEGYAEAERLIGRLHTIIDRTLDKRKDILEALEGQVVELAILVVRRVVKVLSENQKNVVINNILQALQRLKSRSDLIIRVNLTDLEFATEHTTTFVRAIEGNGKLTLAEDSTVEPGGCVIETEFGEIDARISSQLNEIESRIRDLLPISVRPNSLDDSKL